MTSKARAILLKFGQAVFFGVVSVLIFLAVLVALSGPSQRERRETALNVRLLVDESRVNRELLCLTLIHEKHPAVHDERIQEICAEVGVEP